MKTNLIKNSVKGIGLSLLMAVGLVAFSGTEANAQYRDRDDRQERREDLQERREDRQDRRDDRYDRNRGYGRQAEQFAGRRSLHAEGRRASDPTHAAEQAGSARAIR